MPKKLVLLIIGICIITLLNILGGSWIRGVIGVAVIIGVFRGNEGMRNILVVISGIHLFTSVALLCMAFIKPAERQGAIVLIGILGTCVNGFAIWCLRHRDVEKWMFEKDFSEK